MSCLEWTSSFRYTRFVYVFTVFSETSRARAMAATVSPEGQQLERLTLAVGQAVLEG